jgi:uncharacterized protein HemX
MSPRTQPGGIPIVIEQKSPPPVGSRTFVAILSVILGIVVSTTAIIGFSGRYFFVDRAEYAQQELKAEAQKGETMKILQRVETTLDQQASSLARMEKSFERLSDIVRGVELGRRRR